MVTTFEGSPVAGSLLTARIATEYVVEELSDDIVIGDVASVGERAVNVAPPSNEYS
jgi:hypothetical protein